MCSTRLIQWSLLVLAYHHMFSSGSMNVEFSRLTEIDPKKKIVGILDHVPFGASDGLDKFMLS